MGTDGHETASSKDFSPRSNWPRDLSPKGRLWASQNSWNCLGLESQGQSRVFGFFVAIEHEVIRPGIGQRRDGTVPRFFCPGLAQKSHGKKSSKWSQSLGFGCPRDFLPGIFPAIFVPVSSVPRESVPILVRSPGIPV